MKTYTATDARKQWFDIIEQAGKPGSYISIQHRDLPNVVLMSTDELEGWHETLDIVGDPITMKEIQCGIEEINNGDKISLDDLKKELNL